jgi:hypothetical protein
MYSLWVNISPSDPILFGSNVPESITGVFTTEEFIRIPSGGLFVQT